MLEAMAATIPRGKSTPPITLAIGTQGKHRLMSQILAACEVTSDACMDVGSLVVASVAPSLQHFGTSGQSVVTWKGWQACHTSSPVPCKRPNMSGT